MAKRSSSQRKNEAVATKPQEDTTMKIAVPNVLKALINFLSSILRKLTGFKKFQPKSYTPILTFLLIIASFLLGMLFTKVQYLEKNPSNTLAQVQGAATADAGNAANAGTQQPTPGQKVNVALGDTPAQGDANAKVKIIEFADYRCPFCEQFYKDTVPQIISDYVNTGKASFYFRNFAFLGPASVVAANAAECANEQGKFWAMHDYLYTNQPDESNTTMYNTDTLTTAAGTLGLNTDQFRSCLSSNKYQKVVDKDQSDGQAAGVSGTPTIFINGTPLVGAEPYSTIKPIIEAALAGK